MLELNNIVKDYDMGDSAVHALRDVSIKFRKSEFVAILGPSGCGKTTLLNIIGGLDKYTSGDLVINSRSTKDYRDRDWDAYRNHSIGFVFQSYNLIPHQSVLQNVELALTIAGVKKSERRKRAIEALKLVGLGNQLKKRPNEMSGGQMQRVAIARAIVNNPDIILADEPTGALDTETSIQVMDILKEISKDRLVIMVTHNPDLAQKYATRTINMLDGKVLGDTNPIAEGAVLEIRNEDKKSKKPSMALPTAFGLSLKNLFTKKGRTILTAFAGSIGIIGIALIYAVSQGTTNYINSVQEDTLSSYPLMLEAKHVDIGTLLETFMGQAGEDHTHELDGVYQKAALYDMVNALSNMEETENDLKSFKSYLESQMASEDDDNKLKNAISGIQYTYALDMLVYTKGVDGEIIRSDTKELLSELLAKNIGIDMETLKASQSTGFSSMMPQSQSGQNLWQEILTGTNGEMINPLLKKQYDLIYGSWPNAYNEIVLVVDENNELGDIVLYALGLKTREDVDKIMKASLQSTSIEFNMGKWSFEDICARPYRVILNSDCFVKDETTGYFKDLRDTDAGLKYLYDNGIDLKVVGIIRQNKDAVSAMMTGAIGYTKALTEYVVSKSHDSDAIKAQIENDKVDILTGKRFKDTDVVDDSQKATELKAYLSSMNTEKKAENYLKIITIPDKTDVDKYVDSYMANVDRASAEATMVDVYSAQTGMDKEQIYSYFKSMSDEEVFEVFKNALAEQYSAEYAAGVMKTLVGVDKEQLANLLDDYLSKIDDMTGAELYDSVIEFSNGNYDSNMSLLGYVDLDMPATINLYASTFASKEDIVDAIAEYNEGAPELSKIIYTDYIGILMSSITTIIDAITYVLIAFVSVSLVVSSIMIGVITLISVQERTKEIGILRAIGASKRDVSSMFNAETMIIGFASGLVGVGFTYLLCLPINLILHKLTGIMTLSASLPIITAVILILISLLLTLIAGIIPSRSAAKKDPVVALRTE